MNLAIGHRVAVIDAFGETREKRVVSLISDTSFSACNNEEWDAALSEGRPPEADPFPWPIEDVRSLVAVDG